MGARCWKLSPKSTHIHFQPHHKYSLLYFAQKFLEQLIVAPGKEDAIDLLKYLVKGARITALTGEQGCRKNNNAYGYDRKYI